MHSIEFRLERFYCVRTYLPRGVTQSIINLISMIIIIIILFSNKHPYMLVTKNKKQKNKKKQCKQDISIYHEQIKRLLSSILMTLLCRSL